MPCPRALHITAQCGCIALSALLRCLLPPEEELHAAQERVWLLCCAMGEVHSLPYHPPTHLGAVRLTKHMGHCSQWVCAGHCEDGAEQQAWDPEGNLPMSAMSHVKGKCWGNTEAAIVLFHSVFLVCQNKELILGDEAWGK